MRKLWLRMECCQKLGYQLQGNFFLCRLDTRANKFAEIIKIILCSGVTKKLGLQPNFKGTTSQIFLWQAIVLNGKKICWGNRNWMADIRDDFQAKDSLMRFEEKFLNLVLDLKIWGLYLIDHILSDLWRFAMGSWAPIIWTWKPVQQVLLTCCIRLRLTKIYISFG